MSRQALGKGLRSLIPESDSLSRGQVAQIGVEKITANPFQPRKEFDQEKLQQLAESIKQHGVLEPIILRRIGGEYQIVVGERRWRACGLAGLTKIPAIIKEFTDRQMTEMALIENLQREDLNAIEEAEGYQILVDEFALTQEEIAESVGKKRSSVANALRLLNLDRQVKQLVAGGQLSRGHAKVLLAVENPREQQRYAGKVLKDELSVRQLEKLIKAKQHRDKAQKPAEDPEIRVLEEELQQSLGTKVKLFYRGGRGKIEIEYYSDDELERILDVMRS